MAKVPGRSDVMVNPVNPVKSTKPPVIMPISIFRTSFIGQAAFVFSGKLLGRIIDLQSRENMDLGNIGRQAAGWIYVFSTLHIIFYGTVLEF